MESNALYILAECPFVLGTLVVPSGRTRRRFWTNNAWRQPLKKYWRGWKLTENPNGEGVTKIWILMQVVTSWKVKSTSLSSLMQSPVESQQALCSVLCVCLVANLQRKLATSFDSLL